MPKIFPCFKTIKKHKNHVHVLKNRKIKNNIQGLKNRRKNNIHVLKNKKK